MRNEHPWTPAPRPKGGFRVLWSILLVIFVAGGLFSGYLFFASVRDIVAYAELPFLVGAPAGVPSSESPSSPAAGTRQPTERVNILFLGIDRRDNDPGPWRTDTMILFSIDPISKTVSMLSMPRDLWVPLPDYGAGPTEGRINSAHVIGDEVGYPGGGPALAKATVRYNFGIPVHYYVRMDFRGFVKIIDEIGGIDIDVPKDIVDTAYPTPDYGVTTVRFSKGRQHMNGERALQYARTRHADNDIWRARRQQQVILAVRDQVLGLNYSLARIPGMLATLGESVKTDMSLEEIRTLAALAQQVQPDNIKSGVIDESMVISWTTPDGAMVLIPQREKVRDLIAELFPVNPAPAPLGTLGQRDRLQQEAARIEVQNGTQTGALASKTAADLRAAGYNVVRYGNADRFDYQKTVIIYYTEKRYSLASLKEYLQIGDEQVTRKDPPPGNDVDILVILGSNTKPAD